MDELSDPTFLIPPLDAGDRVGTAVGAENVTQLVLEYDAPCDVVAVAVPAGEGVTVETWLRIALGVS